MCDIKQSLIDSLEKKGDSTFLHYSLTSLEGIKKTVDEMSELIVIRSLEDSDGLLIEQELDKKRGWRTIVVGDDKVIVSRFLNA